MDYIGMMIDGCVLFYYTSGTTITITAIGNK